MKKIMSVLVFFLALAAVLTFLPGREAEAAGGVNAFLSDNTLRWNAVAGADKYAINWQNAETAGVIDLDPGVTSFDLGVGLWERGKPFGSYSIRVRALKGTETVASSSALSWEYDHLISLSVSDGNLSWGAFPGAESYRWRVSGLSGGTEFTGTVEKSVTRYDAFSETLVANQLPTGTYRAKIEALDSSGAVAAFSGWQQFSHTDPGKVVTDAVIYVANPAVGEKPDTAPRITLTGGDYTSVKTLWSPYATTFSEGRRYTVAITVTLDRESSYRGLSGLTAKVNHGTATLEEVKPNKVFTVKYTFDKLPVQIAAARVSIAPPVAGEKPSYDAFLPSPVNYWVSPVSSGKVKNGVYWSDLTDENNITLLSPDAVTFEAGHTYRVTVCLSEKDGYEFISSPACYVNGKEASMCYLISKRYYELSYDFPVTGATAGPVILVHPKPVTVEAGSYGSFSVTAAGGGLSYQWQYSKDYGSTWKDWAGKTTAAVSVKATGTNDRTYYRAVVKNASGEAVSGSAILTVSGIVTTPVITENPQSAAVTAGTRVTFQAAAKGPNLSYQWQYLPGSGSSWKTWAGKTSPTVTVTAHEGNDGCRYRLLVSNSYGTVVTSTATLTLLSKPAITSQPKSVTLQSGMTASFSVTATGGALSYQWQYSTDNGKTWKTWSGKTSSTASVTASSGNDGCLYRVRVKNEVSTVFSSAAKLTLTKKPVITKNPASVTLAAGQTASFSVEAAGTGLSYQWQYSADNGKSWKTWTGKTASTASVTAAAGNNGLLYRSAVKNAFGTVYSSSAKLTVSGVKPAIRVQPQNASAAKGKTASFSVTAAGTGLSCQWEYSKDAGKTWNVWSGKTASQVTVNAKNNDGWLYRCVVKNASGSVTSAAAKLTVTG